MLPYFTLAWEKRFWQLKEIKFTHSKSWRIIDTAGWHDLIGI